MGGTMEQHTTANCIPSELKAYPNWVCGDASKVPFNPKSGKKALADVPGTWGAYDEAVQYLQSHKNNGIRTIGFEVGKSPFVGIDIDHCRKSETGQIEQWAQGIIGALDSYTEVSPSSTGIRIFVTADEQFPFVNRKRGGLGESGKGAVEIANTGKYFSITGNHLEATPDWICKRAEELRKVFDQYFPEKAPENISKVRTEISLEDNEILQKAGNTANGAVFTKLYSGDWSDYPSQSEADMALCCHLAFWTGKNPEQIDSLFRQSGLYRDKWDRTDYSTLTVRRAIETTQDAYGEKKTAPPRAEINLTFPDIMQGAAGNFATAYSDITEAPKQFYYLCYLACLGSYLSGKITLNTLINVQPRLYLILLGPSGRGRKSTPINVSTDFFKDVYDNFSIMHHAGSGEGLGVHLDKQRNTLLCYDEFLGFVSKAMQKGNTLLGTVTTLFEKNAYQTATKDRQLVINDAHLSMIGACTIDTWERCWQTDFTAIGLNNRLFLAPGVMDKFVSIPPKLDTDIWKSLRDELRDILSKALSVKEYSLTSEALFLYDKWYTENLDHQSLHSVRLDQYALRFMLLFAVNEFKDCIDVPIVEAVIRLVNWQFNVRQLHDPIDADNENAKIEAKIKRVLGAGPLSKRELQQRTNYKRSGLWLWNNALDNLTRYNEVSYNHKQYSLVAE
jgi:hypothetical protein